MHMNAPDPEALYQSSIRGRVLDVYPLWHSTPGALDMLKELMENRIRSYYN